MNSKDFEVFGSDLRSSRDVCSIYSSRVGYNRDLEMEILIVVLIRLIFDNDYGNHAFSKSLKYG